MISPKTSVSSRSATVAPKFVVLLPPSEGKALGGEKKLSWRTSAGAFGKSLSRQRQQVVDALTHAHGGSQALFGVSRDHLKRAQTANTQLVGAPTLPAWERYTGVVWDHLDIASLTATQRARAMSSIVVVSGLHGLVTAADPIPDYRLKMGARLAPLGSLSAWWRDTITTALHAYAKNAVIIDLLPNEHRGAIEWESLPRVMRVDLIAKKGGRAGGHNAKAAKGELARHIICAGSTAASAQSSISTFRHADFSAKVAS